MRKQKGQKIKDESAQKAFFDNVEKIRAGEGKKQIDIARGIGCTHMHLNAVWNVRKNLSSDIASRIAKYLGTTVPELYGKGDICCDLVNSVSAEYRPISLASCRNGQLYVVENSKSKTPINAYVVFDEGWLQHKGNIESMAIVVLRGGQVGGMVPDGALVLIDESQKTLVDGKSYLVSTDGDVRLVRYSVVRDVDFHGQNATGFYVIGKAIWYGFEF